MEGVERTINVMYKSPILKRAIEILYMTQPWRDAVTLPLFKDNNREPSPDFVLDDEGYASRPLISFVAFAATAVSTSD